MSDHVLAACRKYGYLGAMSLTDALNRPGEELFWLNRTALHDQMYEPFYNEYDPYRNIRHAQADNGWIIDYCHCPLETAGASEQGLLGGPVAPPVRDRAVGGGRRGLVRQSR